MALNSMITNNSNHSNENSECNSTDAGSGSIDRTTIKDGVLVFKAKDSLQSFCAGAEQLEEAASMTTPDSLPREKKVRSITQRIGSWMNKKLYNKTKLRTSKKKVSLDLGSTFSPRTTVDQTGSKDDPTQIANSSSTGSAPSNNSNNASPIAPVAEQKEEQKEAPSALPATKSNKLRESAPKQEIISVDGKKYVLRGCMGAGTYGFVRSAWQMGSGKKVAVKFFKEDNADARREIEIYRQASNGCDNYLPKLLHTCTYNGKLVLIAERQGHNLGHLSSRIPKKRFYPQTIAMLGMELMNAFEEFHNTGLVHRDIHMGNVLCGYRKEQDIYLCDLGFSQQWRKPNGEHVERKELQVAVGTSRFSSINNHKHTLYSRRDDMESLGYLLINSLCGELPWNPCSKIQNRRKKWDTIMKHKLEFEETDFFLCLPQELQHFVSYAKSLKFDEEPDYDYCRSLFKSMKEREEKRHGVRYFDWMYVWEQ